MVKGQESEEQHSLLGLPFDHYARYALTRQLVGIIRAGSQAAPYRILDVGGHSSPLKHFLPEDTVVLLDVEPVGSLTSIEFSFDEYVRGSGAALPFRDMAFDIVTAHDTLEHVPAEFRTAFLEEILRVAGEFVILGGPLWSPEVAQAEARLDSFVRNTLQWDQPFLREHIELGLPEPEMIEAFFTSRRMPFVGLPSGNLDRWLAMQALRHYLASLPDAESLCVELDRAYNRLYSETDDDGVCYRWVYVIARNDRDALERVSAQTLPAPADAKAHLDAIEELLVGLEAHASTMRDHLRGLHERIFRAEQEVFEARGGREEALAVLRERESEIIQQKQAIAELNSKLAMSNAELAGLRKIYRSARRSVRRLIGPRKQ